MVTGSCQVWGRRRASITAEMIFALSILAVAVVPLSFSFLREQKLCRAYYQRAVALEVVDGEMEVLVAGEWQTFALGTHVYTPKAEAIGSLPAGTFTLTVAPDRLRLVWEPEAEHQGGRVEREVRLELLPGASPAAGAATVDTPTAIEPEDRR
ncbi:MAG: hypothetical protein FJ387_20225 [Verrucomicrobia bacterium]|nr:hypothetical protein [Verrucomicrobiota bacterium]